MSELRLCKQKCIAVRSKKVHLQSPSTHDQGGEAVAEAGHEVVGPSAVGDGEGDLAVVVEAGCWSWAQAKLEAVCRIDGRWRPPPFWCLWCSGQSLRLRESLTAAGAECSPGSKCLR